ncbi:MAG: hypothetical protein WCG93_09140 [Paludibacter sp.]
MNKADTMGLSGLVSIYPLKNLWESIKCPLLIDLVIWALILKFEGDIYAQIQFLSETILAVVPNILGFILTGYTVVVSVTESRYLKAMVKPNPDKNVSLYQIVNSTFAAVLLALCTTLLVGFLSNYMLKANLCTVAFLSGYTHTLNALTLFVLIFLFLYSIFAIKDVVINVFNFGQFIN